jgi:hypothetical protein
MSVVEKGLYYIGIHNIINMFRSSFCHYLLRLDDEDLHPRRYSAYVCMSLMARQTFLFPRPPISRRAGGLSGLLQSQWMARSPSVLASEI